MRIVFKVLFTLLALLLLLAVAGYFLIEPPKMPQPDGKYRVGFSEFELNSAERWVQVQAWYPTEQQQGVALPYSQPYIAQALAQFSGFPEALLLDERPSAALIDVAIAPGQHPVILFNHGYASYVMAHLSQLEQLASHGFIVLALAHPQHSMVLKRANGELLYKQMNAPEQDIALQQQMVQALALSLPKLQQLQDLTVYRRELAELEQPLVADTAEDFTQWLANNQLVLDLLPALNQGEFSPIFAQSLALDRIGALGFSFGGSLASHLALNDTRIKAAMNYDGMLRAESLRGEHRAPQCHVYADATRVDADTVMAYPWLTQPLMPHLDAPSCEVLFAGATHFNFTNLTFIQPLSYFGLIGAIDGMQMHHDLMQLTQSFFAHHLQQSGQLAQGDVLLQRNVEQRWHR